MTIRRFPLADGRAPLEAPEPDGVIQSSIGLFERFRGQIQKKTDSQLVRRVLGCDGRSVVTAYRGDCQDDARAINGGGAALGVDLGNGVIVPVAADLGRSYVASSGYQGDGLAAGAFPAPTAATAVDLALDPIDQAGGVVISGEAADAGAARAAALGAAVAGKTGDSKRLIASEGVNGAEYFQDVLVSSPAAVTGLTIAPWHVAAIGADRYAFTGTWGQLLVEIATAAAKTSDVTLPTQSGRLNGPLAAAAVDIGSGVMAVGGFLTVPPTPPAGYDTIYIGDDIDGTPSWTYADLGGRSIKDDLPRSLAWADGVLYAAVETAGSSGIVRVVALAAPYSAVTAVGIPSAPTELMYVVAASRDGRWLASGYDSGSSVVDMWRLGLGSSPHQVLAASGCTAAVGPGALAIGPDNKVFALVYKTSEAAHYLAVWTPLSAGSGYTATPELIPLPEQPGLVRWLTVSGDGQCCAIVGGAGGLSPTIITVEAPFTAGGATTGVVSASNDIKYMIEFDPSEAYADAQDLTLSADVTTADVGGQLQSTIRLDYRNEGLLDAFGVLVTLPVAGRSVVSVSGDGIYDSEAEVITWFFPALGVGASGYVTAVLVAR